MSDRRRDHLRIVPPQKLATKTYEPELPIGEKRREVDKTTINEDGSFVWHHTKYNSRGSQVHQKGFISYIEGSAFTHLPDKLPPIDDLHPLKQALEAIKNLKV